MPALVRDYTKCVWWAVNLPGPTIPPSVLAINLMGDGLHGASDPKLENAV